MRMPLRSLKSMKLFMRMATTKPVIEVNRKAINNKGRPH